MVREREEDQQMSGRAGVSEQNADRHCAAVVGAGVAGLSCARRLVRAGWSVQVFDKARGAGGRTSTRRAGSFGFDHGAQYFTVRDATFREVIEPLRAEGIVAPWDGEIVVLENGGVRPDAGSVERLVGVPGMNALARHLATVCPVRFGARVERLERVGPAWRLVGDGGEGLGGWDSVVLSAPPRQAAVLLETAGSELATTASDVPMSPCWAVMAGFSERVEVPFDGAFVNDGPLRWLARNTSKPGRSTGESWVLHASAEWSRAEIEADADEVARTLLSVFRSLSSAELPALELVKTHRWRYALPPAPLSSPYLVDEERRLAVCGDWCGGPRVEGAFLSGLAAAEALVSAG